MSIKKEYFKTKTSCKVTFVLPKEYAADAKIAFVVGDFNQWNPKKLPMKKLKNGEFKAAIELEKDKTYHFKYLIDKNNWVVDSEANYFAPDNFGGENAVITL